MLNVGRRQIGASRAESRRRWMPQPHSADALSNLDDQAAGREPDWGKYCIFVYLGAAHLFKANSPQDRGNYSLLSLDFYSGASLDACSIHTNGGFNEEAV